MSEKIINCFDGEYTFLSNFYESPIQLYDYVYPTVEHYFQARKSTSLVDHDKILAAPTPGKAKRLGRKVTLRGDWDLIKDGIMYQAVKAKFEQNSELRQKLIDTGDAMLIEGNTWNDTYWGVCEGVGENHLGKILMKVRSELRDAE